MDDDPNNFTALSFVDVMANGMGSLLVLFILTTIIRDVITPNEAPPIVGESSEGVGVGSILQNPQMIFIRSASKKKLPIELPVPTTAWTSDPPLPHGTTLSVGYDYAAIYAPRRLEGHTISLAGLQPGLEVALLLPDSSTGITIQKRSRVDSDGILRIWTIRQLGGNTP